MTSTSTFTHSSRTLLTDHHFLQDLNAPSSVHVQDGKGGGGAYSDATPALNNCSVCLISAPFGVNSCIEDLVNQRRFRSRATLPVRVHPKRECTISQAPTLEPPSACNHLARLSASISSRRGERHSRSSLPAARALYHSGI